MDLECFDIQNGQHLQAFRVQEGDQVTLAFPKPCDQVHSSDGESSLVLRIESPLSRGQMGGPSGQTTKGVRHVQDYIVQHSSTILQHRMPRIQLFQSHQNNPVDTEITSTTVI